MTFDAAETKLTSEPSSNDMPKSSGSAVTLPYQCRQMAIEKIGKAISDAHDKVIDELYDLAEQSLDRDTRDYYLQAKEDWPTLRSRIETRSRERLEGLFDDRSGDKNDAPEDFSRVQTSWMDLSLVADGDLEESMRFTEIAARMKNGFEEELSALDQRMAALLGKPGMESHDNPLAPMAVCDAYRSALGAVESGLKLKLILIRMFDTHARSEIVKFYKSLNALLKDNGILPNIRHGSLKKPVGGTGPVTGPKTEGPQVVGSVTLPLVAGAAAAKSGAASATLSVPIGTAVGGTGTSSAGVPAMTATGGAGVAATLSVDNAAGLPQDPFAMLQQLMMNVGSVQGRGVAAAGGLAGASGGAGGAAGFGAPSNFGNNVAANSTHGILANAGNGAVASFGNGAAGSGGVSAGNGGVAVASGAQLIGSLTRLQHGDFTALPDDLPAALEAAGWGGIGGGSSGHDGTGYGDTGSGSGSSGGYAGASRDRVAPAENILHKLKSTSLASQMGQMDTVTLDIVAMLFDQIFGDARVPAAMKALIGRLQIPMLKVAVIDKAFFSKKTHPARRTLDTLGELSLGLGDGFNAESSLYQRIDSLVQRLVDEFEEDFGVFDQVTRELESLITDANTTAERAAKKEAKRIQDKERLEVARIFAQNEIKQRVQRQALPRAVLRFLMVDWMKLLILAYAKGGRESRAWHSLVETLDILVWSLTPKHAAEDRKRLVALLPALLKRLDKGMEVIGTTHSNRERFNAVLMRCHAKAIGGMDAAFVDVELPLPSEKKVVKPAANTEPQPSTTIAPSIVPVLPHMAAGSDTPQAEEEKVPTLAPITAQDANGAPVEKNNENIPTLEPLDGASMVYVTAEPIPAPVVVDAEPERSVEEVLDAMLPENIAEAPTLQEEMAQTTAPDNFPALNVRNPFGDGDIQVEEVSFGDLPGFSSGVSPSQLLDNGDKHTQMARAMKEGDWIEIRDDDRDPVQARLSYLSPYGGTYVFSNRKGVKLAEMSLYQLTRDLRCARIVLIDDVPLFDRAFGGLVGMLKKGATEVA